MSGTAPRRDVAWTRRRWLGTAAALPLAAGALPGCRPGPDDATAVPAAWTGAAVDRGHRLREAAAGPLPAPSRTRRAAALVLGAGVAGLAAARVLAARGIDDVHVLELEDAPGGNARGHAIGGLRCPLGAHYLPLPGPDAHELVDWLHEIGLLRHEAGRRVADERHLCHRPQERLFIDGAWAEGLLPPAEPGSPTARQYARFAQAIAAAGGGRADGAGRAYALPAHRARWSAEADALNRRPFARWLDEQGFDDARLRWYLDYCCRDDYGVPADTVSAWAGVHYFASRHGFAAPGDGVDDGERDRVFTWPEGNAWLVERLAAPLAGGRLHTGRTVLRIAEQRHGVRVLAWDTAAQAVEAWEAPLAVCALPLWLAARLVEPADAALQQAAVLGAPSVWLVANLRLREPPLARTGAAPAWDNVVYGSAGALGVVDAGHQRLRPDAAALPTVWTAYHALPASERPALLAPDPGPWRDRVLRELAAVHPDIARRVERVDLQRWGHAMAVPRPGVHRHPALQALRARRGRLRFAHADLAGYSVFEEAFTAGCEAAAA